MDDAHVFSEEAEKIRIRLVWPYVLLDKLPLLGKETFATGKGDCEDYAIAKYVVLTAAGFPRDDLRLLDLRL